MAAGLHSCCLSPSPAFSPAASSSARPLTPSAILPVGRRGHFLPRLKLQTAAKTAPRTRLAAQNRDEQPANRPDNHFFEESEEILQYHTDILSTGDGCLYLEATAMSARVCLAANEALIMASDVMDSAGLILGAPNEISTDTIHGTVRMYATVFMNTAEDSFHRMVTKNTVTSFLGAFKGLAAISHILLEDGLEALSHKFPRDSLSEYAFNADVAGLYGQFKQQMNDLEANIQNASDIETCKLVMPTIQRATQLGSSFVGLMMARRKRALGKAHSKLIL